MDSISSPRISVVPLLIPKIVSRFCRPVRSNVDLPCSLKPIRVDEKRGMCSVDNLIGLREISEEGGQVALSKRM